MSEPIISQKGPYIEVVKPNKYAWCACGRSVKQPYCDGTHQGSGKSPLAYTAETKEQLYVCGCGKTGTIPFCDGSHNR